MTDPTPLAEAQDLRCELEKWESECEDGYIEWRIRAILDAVDARDSLRYLEHRETVLQAAYLLLESLQWCIDGEWRTERFCPICRGDSRQGHRNDCRLVMVLELLQPLAGVEPVEIAMVDENSFQELDPRRIRSPDGNINNCLLANEGYEVHPEHGPCQICGGNCPDRERLVSEHINPNKL
jgi:hypothetical protein